MKYLQLAATASQVVSIALALSVGRRSNNATALENSDAKHHIMHNATVLAKSNVEHDTTNVRFVDQNPECTANSLWSTAPLGTNCPREDWFDAMVEADPAPGKIFMDIGCNKGNDAMKWMERWDMSTNHFWSTKKWMQYFHEKLQVGNYVCPSSPNLEVTAAILKGCEAGWGCTCQGISDCYGAHHMKHWGTAPAAAQKWWIEHNCATIPSGAACPRRESKSTQGPKPVGICVEPMLGNIKLLHQASEDLGYGPHTPHGSFHIVQAAVLDKAAKNQTVDFPDGSPGQENLGLPALFRVPVKTVDGLKAELSLPRVDILAIDTEGADPFVLQGAMATLPTVRYLQFEVHRDLRHTAWGETSLQSVVTMLDQQGFDCYWSGNNGHVLSMNRCWRSKFEVGTWANAACVKRGDVWSDVLKRFEI